MCDQSAEMPGALSPATGEGGGEESVTSGQQDRGAQGRGEESGASGGEVGQEDEEMTSGSHELSSLANHSPGSATGLAAKSLCLNGEHADGGRGQAHREVKITVAEMKKRLPSGKRSRSKAPSQHRPERVLMTYQIHARDETSMIDSWDILTNSKITQSAATAVLIKCLERVSFCVHPSMQLSQSGVLLKCVPCVQNFSCRKQRHEGISHRNNEREEGYYKRMRERMKRTVINPDQ